MPVLLQVLCFSECLGGGDADMLRCDDGALFAHGGKYGAADEDAGSPEDSSRALVRVTDGPFNANGRICRPSGKSRIKGHDSRVANHFRLAIGRLLSGV